MAEYDMAKSTTETSSSDSFTVDANALEVAGRQKETIFDFPNATKYQGYYKTIPELQSALDSLGIWVCGKGYEVSMIDQPILENLEGRGNDTITSLLLNHFVMSKVIGDSFLEIIRNKNGTLVNLKPHGAERVRVIENKKGIIIRYEVQQGENNWNKIKPQNMFHKTNERTADEGRGKSVIFALEWVIDAMQEAMNDGRLVYHRNVFPLQIIEYDGENTTKRDALLLQYADAIKTGKALVVPKGVITISDAGVTIQDPIAWLNYLSSYFYQVIRISRLIATSEGSTELDSKMGYLSFEPMYTYEQNIYEAEIWNQLAIRIKFKRPASLGGTMQQDEQKNTGQVGIQPNDVEASLSQE